jgi:hypothetical protein
VKRLQTAWFVLAAVVAALLGMLLVGWLVGPEDDSSGTAPAVTGPSTMTLDAHV